VKKQSPSSSVIPIETASASFMDPRPKQRQKGLNKPSFLSKHGASSRDSSNSSGRSSLPESIETPKSSFRIENEPDSISYEIGVDLTASACDGHFENSPDVDHVVLSFDSLQKLEAEQKQACEAAQSYFHLSVSSAFQDFAGKLFAIILFLWQLWNTHMFWLYSWSRFKVCNASRF
jgi:hypothetical protein